MSETTLTFTRTLKASPAAVWRCWTEPDLIKQWFAPKPVETTVVEIELTPGGRFRTVMEVPGHGTMDNAPGCILVADAPHRLVWTSALGPGFHPTDFGDDPHAFAFSAEILIESDPAGCRYTATAMHATPAAAQTHETMGFYDGWGTATTQLEALAATL